MQTVCDRCGESIKKVGRLTNVHWKGLKQKICKFCKRKLKIAYH